MEKVVLKTKDGKNIVCDYYEGIKDKGVIMIHMMPSNRSSWWNLAVKLEDEEYKTIAIDLRGHGESDGGPDGYKSFTDKEHQKSVYDIEAAELFLEEEGVDKNEIALIGASIGANLALLYASLHHNIKSIILLSAGLDYRGIKSEPLIKKLASGQKILFASSLDDFRANGNNAEMNQYLYNITPSGIRKKLIIYKNAGHGTDMFNKEKPDLIQEIIRWIKE